MDKIEFSKVDSAIGAAINRVLSKGADDVFRPPIFSHSIESEILTGEEEDFRKRARSQTLKFLSVADLETARIGPTRRTLVLKDHNSFRMVAWLDPFDAVSYLSLALLLFPVIERSRIAKDQKIVHSHRISDTSDDIFDPAFGYDSFRARSSEISSSFVGKWKVVTDIANFFDRIGNHSLENNLLNIGCEKKYVHLVRELLFFWSGDRRSFGVPVGSDASRILSEAALLNVDRRLLEYNINFIRYVDDFRIFTNTREEALKAVEILTVLLGDEGLSLNSRKTGILPIVEPEEVAHFANRFSAGEHEKIDIDAKEIITRTMRVSGRPSVSKFYREPGKEALKKIKSMDKDNVLELFLNASVDDVETHLKLLVKYFVYADQDVFLIQKALDERMSSIFYIADALIKESNQFSTEKRTEICVAVYESVNWLSCAYPFQVPILRLSGSTEYREPKFVRAIVDAQLQTDSMLFFREAISLGYPGLDRPRLRKLAMDVFPDSPDFVRRAIYCAVQRHSDLSEDEKRPILRNMRQNTDDWFIRRIAAP